MSRAGARSSPASSLLICCLLGKTFRPPACSLSTYIPLVLSPVLPLVVGVSHPAVAVHVDVTCRQKEKDKKGQHVSDGAGWLGGSHKWWLHSMPASPIKLHH